MARTIYATALAAALLAFAMSGGIHAAGQAVHALEQQGVAAALVPSMASGYAVPLKIHHLTGL